MSNTADNNGLCPSLPTGKKMASYSDGRELHTCMGLNSCKNNDLFGDNDCSGKGYCATAVPHVCKTLNECKGQGGCGLFGDASDQCHPGENDCKYQGTCGTPVQAERFSTNGPNMNLSVWVLARKRFEQRMDTKGEKYGDSPCCFGPPQQWLEAVFKNEGKSYDSCGSNGDKRCSYGYNDADTSAREMIKKSKESVGKVITECGCTDGD